MPLRKPTKKSSNPASRISKARLAAMIEEATVDAYGDSEQTTGWYTMLEEHLALPFETTVLGVLVKVVALDVRGDNGIVAICTRGRERQSVPILDLPLPSPRPEGANGSRRTVTGSGVDPEPLLRHGRGVACDPAHGSGLLPSAGMKGISPFS